MVGLGFKPWVGHLGTWEFFPGEVTEKLYISKIERLSGDAPANQPKVAGVCRRQGVAEVLGFGPRGVRILELEVTTRVSLPESSCGRMRTSHVC